MTTIILCEKSSQAENIRAAIGTSYGKIFAAQGHLLRLTLPSEEVPGWNVWSCDLLRPPLGRYRLKPDSTGGKASCLKRLKVALDRADTVILATDCDREGQAIGENVLRYFDFRGVVKRALFTAEDHNTLAHAFRQVRPNGDFANLYQAAVARQQADQIFNLSLTRAATVSLVPKGERRVIGIGRVKTPTMALVCRREEELKAFAPRDYFELAADLSSAHGPVRLFYRPQYRAQGLERIFDVAKAEQLTAALRGWQGPIDVKKERKSRTPPLPFDLPSLQMRAAAWGWTARRTLDTAQSLYDTHKVITYPRAATRYLPEAMIGPARTAYEGLAHADIASVGRLPEPVIRTGPGTAFFEAGLHGEPHHAIIPNPAVAGDFSRRLAGLPADERKLFDLIAQAFVACLGPDHIYDRTEIAIEPVVDGVGIRLNAVGRVTVEEGWKAIKLTQPGDIEDEASVGQDGDQDSDEQALPPLAEGDTVTVERVTIDRKVTTAPPRYTEGSLIKAMHNAWKFVADPNERLRLKAARGIGTPATRDAVIEGLKTQRLLETKAGKLYATEVSMAIYGLLKQHCPELVDPGATARMEMRLDAVVRGDLSGDSFIDEVCQVASGLIGKLSQCGERAPALPRKPSAKMVAAVRQKAGREGVRLSADMLGDFGRCRAFLGPLPELGGAAHAPSPAQLSFAERISERCGVALRKAERHNATELSHWIDAHNTATEKQIKWIRKFVEEGRIKPPAGYPDHVAASDASKILDSAFCHKAKPRRA